MTCYTSFLFILGIFITLGSTLSAIEEAPNVPCTYEKGEGYLQDYCFCENTYNQFGNKESATIIPENGVKIAFLSDSGTSTRVLNMLKNEQVDAIVHAGDLDYNYTPSDMEDTIDEVFDPSFPYFYAIGNHEVQIWRQYRTKNLQRLAKIPQDDIYCTGNIGVKSICYYKGIELALIGPGTLCNNHDEYILNNLIDSAPWKFCVFHKVHSTFQIGTKTNEVDLDVYQACIDRGAIVMTGHDHSYARTYPISDAIQKTINKSAKQPYVIKPGETLVFLNGVGGRSLYPTISANSYNPWWEAAFGRNINPNYGAVICTFKQSLANCQFKTISNKVEDTINLITDTSPTQCVPSCPECTKSWLPPVPDNCGGYCPMDNCGPDERCSSYHDYTCVKDIRCLQKCYEKACVHSWEHQPTNWCGGTCNLPSC